MSAGNDSTFTQYDAPMNHLTDAVKTSVQQKNWYAALALALTLPDICSKMESPKEQTGKRFPRWVNEHFAPLYTREMGYPRTKHVFLGGQDFYALRCAVLHEGSDSIVEQRARDAIEKFRFVTPPAGGGSIHSNQVNEVLQLQVDLFCLDVCKAVDSWLATVQNGSEAETRISELMEIEDLSNTDHILF